MVKMQEQTKTANRKEYLDYLRILATLATISIHVGSQNWRKVDVNSFQWNMFNIYICLTKWAVPMFVMISGALFLNNQKPLTQKKLYGKYILRIVLAYVFWAFVYTWLYTDRSLGSLIKGVIEGYYHLWFLPMLIGLYMIVPFLRKITESMVLVRQFLCLALAAQVFSGQFITMLKLASNEKLAALGASWGTLWGDAAFHFTLGYVGYFVAGYYFSKVEIGKHVRRILYFLGVAGAVWTMLMTRVISLEAQKAVNTYYNVFFVNIMVTVLALFVFGRYELSRIRLSSGQKRALQKLSKYSFGAYLVHMLVLNGLRDYLHITSVSLPPLVSVPVIVGIVFAGSMAISAVLNHIPLVKKYLV